MNILNIGKSTSLDAINSLAVSEYTAGIYYDDLYGYYYILIKGEWLLYENAVLKLNGDLFLVGEQLTDCDGFKHWRLVEATDQDHDSPSDLYQTFHRLQKKLKIKQLKNQMAAVKKFSDFIPYIRCGFELETKSSEGCVHDDENAFDEDSWDEAQREWVEDNLPCIDYMSDSTIDRMREDLWEVVPDHFDRSDFYNGEYMEADDFANEYGPFPYTEVGTDYEPGYEFRTIKGGVGITEFCKGAKSVFRLNHEINHDCSFHIHLSVEGLQHVYGKRFQQSMIEYLVEHNKLFPKHMRKRLTSGSLHFCKLAIENDKMTFVSKSDRFNTWEFRCFGDIRNYKDAIRCLMLAVRALQHAYRVQLGMEQLMLPNFEGDFMLDCIRQSRSISEKIGDMINEEELQAA